jgi:hypothetical protein
MCFSVAEERSGGIPALPNGFLKTLVAKRYGDELARYARSVGLECVEIVVDPTLSVRAADERPPDAPRGSIMDHIANQPPGLCVGFRPRQARGAPAANALRAPTGAPRLPQGRRRALT